MLEVIVVEERSYMQRKIILRTTQRDLMSLYSKQGTIDPFRSPQSKPVRRLFLYCLAGCAGLVIAGSIWDSVAWFYFLAAILLLGSICLVSYYFIIILVYRWKVIQWAKSVATAGPAELMLDANGFRMIYDGKEYITRWTAVKGSWIHDDHVTVNTSESFIFPRSSMTDEEFRTLTTILREKIISATEEVESESS